MGLFDSAEEKARKKKLKEEEKERKRKEFERIMASNPKVSKDVSLKLQSKKEIKEQEKIRKAVHPSEQRSYPTTPQYDSNVVCCPKCKSTSITADKKGFSLVKGALGVATVGLYGVIAAGHGKNEVVVTCLKCGHQWKTGK